MKKRLAVIAAAVVLIAAAIIAVFTKAGINGCQTREDLSDRISPADITYSVERMDHSAMSDSGKIIANIYYDLVQIDEVSPEAEKINQILCDDYKDWANCVPDALWSYGENSTINDFMEQVAFMREAFGDSALEESPLDFSVEADVVYRGDNLISIWQVIRWSSGGPAGIYHRGRTYSLESGEMLTFDKIYDVDANEFRRDLRDFLLLQNDLFKWTDNSRIEDAFSPDPDNDFNIEYYGLTYSLNENFYYNGENIWFVIEMLGANDDTVIKWNGKTGDVFQFSF